MNLRTMDVLSTEVITSSIYHLWNIFKNVSYKVGVYKRWQQQVAKLLKTIHHFAVNQSTFHSMWSNTF